MNQPNMTKENRAEIRTLRASRKKITRDWFAEIKHLGREKRSLESALARANRNSEKAVNKIDRRIAILPGRLS